MKEFLDCSGGSKGVSNLRGYVVRGRAEAGSKPLAAKRLVLKDIRAATNDFGKKSYAGGSIFYLLYKGKGSLGLGGIDRPVLVKRYDRGRQEARLMYSAEISILSGLHHPNVVELIGYCEEDGEMLLVYEDICLDFLENRISNPPSSNEVWNWSKRMAIAHGISKGLKCLHEKGVIFRDLRPANILLDKDDNPKIFNFEFARDSARRGATMTELLGRAGYLDLANMNGRFSTKSDIYSFGAILLELITGLEIWDGRRRPTTLGDWVKKQVLDENNNLIDEKLKGIVDECLHDGEYTTSGLYQAVALAISCVDLNEVRRPSIEHVVKKMSQVY